MRGQIEMEELNCYERRVEAIDTLELDTATPSMPALQRFFKNTGTKMLMKAIMQFIFYALRSLAVAIPALSLVSFNVYAVTNAAAAKPAPRASTTADIRDIRGLRHISSPWLFPAWLAGAFALGALGHAGWRNFALSRVLRVVGAPLQAPQNNQAARKTKRQHPCAADFQYWKEIVRGQLNLVEAL